MHWVNWVVLVAYLAYVIIDGLRRSRDTTKLQGISSPIAPFPGGRSGCP
jgi:hypothetical protein